MLKYPIPETNVISESSAFQKIWNYIANAESILTIRNNPRLKDKLEQLYMGWTEFF